MGSRATYGFKANNKFSVTYAQWGSSPDQIGKDVLEFIKSRNLTQLRKACKDIKVVDMDDKPTQADLRACEMSQTIDQEVQDGQLDNYYVILRKAQGKMEKHLSTGLMIDNTLDNGLPSHEEYTYVINLDTQCLNVYEDGELVSDIPFKTCRLKKTTFKDLVPGYFE